jgi:pectate lyase
MFHAFSLPALLALSIVLCALAATAHGAEAALAFPGAEGAGARSRGGRGGPAIAVTTLADYRPGKDAPIPGSLRAACEAKGPRIVVFRVAGTIDLAAPLAIAEPRITIAGQSAPGGGICLKRFGVSVRASDVVIRHLRLRPGDESGKETDALSIGAGSRDVIIDHCSASWANDEVLSVSGEGITGVTVQWCFITESLDRSQHSKGPHGYGSLIRANGEVSFHHNLYAFHSSRSPRPGTYGEGSILLDFRNNAIHRGGRGYAAEDPARLNYVGNFVSDTLVFKATATTQMHAAGNVLEGDAAGTRDNWKLIQGLPAANRRAEPFAAAPVATEPAPEAFEKVLAQAGAMLPKRDAIDERVVVLVRCRGGRVIDSQADVGGWPKLEAAAPPPDADGDGMPDAWEAKHGLDPARPGDALDDRDGDGYTAIEEFLNGTEP